MFVVIQIYDGQFDEGVDEIGFDCGDFSISTSITPNAMFRSTNSLLSVLFRSDGDTTRPGLKFNYTIGS